ncbi:uncharacterized protein LOC131221969 isoform X2 [Magnolia sinica]|uniref:uncharacterized protein LOC131221969 isoform X2 n=1 Tax=Magnolia sinica TaxID=86752 RepID=UPI002658B541|nr:uncharacterized protein LOC131221969 isoform X2 [Magnolia sinica]
MMIIQVSAMGVGKGIATGHHVKEKKAGPGQAKESQVSSSSSKRRSLGFGGKGRKEDKWGCAQGCGACCKLDKGPSFASPEEIFEHPSDVQLYRSLVGPDGWCIHYEKTTRTCSIYPDRPYFCRVEPEIFQDLYGINEKRFNKEACSFCRDTIKAIYGAHSQELDNFNCTVRKSDV